MVDLNKSHKLIFVGGAPRSGTTLVQNMLDSHPLIFGGPEFLHIPDCINLRNKLHYSISREFIDLFCSYDDVDRYIVSLIEHLLFPLADLQGCKFLSEKTPGNVLVFCELIDLFPQAHFIHVVRDPRAIVSSMLLAGKRAKEKGIKPAAYTKNIPAGIAYIRKCFNSGFTASKKAPDNVLTIVYERLVEEPAKETKKICKFLGLEWSDEMLTPGDKKHLGEKAITSKSDEVWYNAKTYYRNPDSQDIGKWKRQLSIARQIRITTAFEDYGELKQLGYDFSIDSLTKAKHILNINYIIFLHLGQKIKKYLTPLLQRIPGFGRIRRALFFCRF